MAPTKYDDLFEKDISELDSLLQTLEFAVVVDIKEAVDRVEGTVDDNNAILRKISATKDRKALAEAQMKDELKEAEIPRSELVYESDKWFAKGGSASPLYVHLN